METYLDAIAKQVASGPDRLAVTDGRRAYTYAELNAAANRIAHTILVRLGPGQDRVGILLGHRAEAIVALVATTKAGKVQVPLHSAAPPARLQEILTHAEARLVVTDAAHRDSLGDLAELALVLDDVPQDLPGDDPDVEIDGDDLVAIYYTSGSTGRPKGVMLGQREMAVPKDRLTADDRTALVGSLAFGGARSYVEALSCGASMHMLDLQAHGPAELATWIADERITSFRTLVPVLRALLDQLPEGENLPDVRVCSAGGEALYRVDVERFRARVNRSCALWHNYASTESRIAVGNVIGPDTELPEGRVPVGKPFPGVEVELADPDEDGVGEIVVRSPLVSRGYWREPELTAAAFSTDPESGLRSFRSGDLGRWREDGSLELVGRRDSRVKIRGYTVDLAEVDTALAGLTGVGQAAVTTMPRGEGLALVAYVVPAQGARPTVNALRRGLLERLPPYMIPARFVLVDAFPLTQSGKVNRRALPPPPATRPELEGDYEAPRDELERTIADVWERVLDVRPVGIEDDFYALGGDSLAVAEATAALNETLDEDLPLVLFDEDSATVAALARHVRDRASSLHSGAAVLQAEGAGTPFFCVGGGGGEVYELRALARALGPERPFYALQPAGREGDRLRRDVRRLAARHLREVLAVQPQGPHLLGGYSAGGTVALELAQQLTQLGMPPAALVLFDSPAPGTRDLNIDPRFQHGLEVRMKKRVLRVLLDLHVRTGRPVPLRWRELHRMDVSGRARARYRPEPYAGRVVLLRAEGHGRAVPEDNGWGKLSSGPLIVGVPGDHQTMLRPPLVSTTADRLRAALRDAEAAAEPEPGADGPDLDAVPAVSVS
jgi:amino acid adenylation domain-containing protein